MLRGEDKLLTIMAGVGIAASIALAVLAESDPTPGNPAQLRALRGAGMRDVKIGGPVVWGCGESDSYFASNEFTATNPVGQRVSGVVCCGLMVKRCTLRF